MAKCKSFRLTSPITAHNMAEGAPHRITLEQTHVLYITQLSDQEALCVCIERVVMCQVDCGDMEFKFDFPDGDCFTILPPGTYEITLGEQYVHTVEDGELGVDLLFEPVDTPFVQSVIANCCN